MTPDSGTGPHDVPAGRRTTRQMTALADKHGSILRQRVLAFPTGALDVSALARNFGVTFMYPQDVRGMSPEDLLTVTGMNPKTWSGMSLALPEGGALVMLNPQQPPERANVTILEEIAHLHFGHRPTRLVALPAGSWKRDYDARAEQEAYWTAAAALLPAQAVGRAVWQAKTADELGRELGASRELAEFRIKTLNLWREYQSRQRKREQDKQGE